MKREDTFNPRRACTGTREAMDKPKSNPAGSNNFHGHLAQVSLKLIRASLTKRILQIDPEHASRPLDQMPVIAAQRHGDGDDHIGPQALEPPRVAHAAGQHGVVRDDDEGRLVLALQQRDEVPRDQRRPHEDGAPVLEPRFRDPVVRVADGGVWREGGVGLGEDGDAGVGFAEVEEG